MRTYQKSWITILYADETPVTMLRPDTGKTAHKAYLWAYATTAYEEKPVVLYEFKPSRLGQNARTFLEGWHGKLVVDDYSGYKRGFIDQNITEIGCWAHARRKVYDLYQTNGSSIQCRRWNTSATYMMLSAKPMV